MTVGRESRLTPERKPRSAPGLRRRSSVTLAVSSGFSGGRLRASTPDSCGTSHATHRRTSACVRHTPSRVAGARAVLGAWLLLTVALVAECTPANPTVYRVNVGGPRGRVAATAGPHWEADTAAAPSPFLVTPAPAPPRSLDRPHGRLGVPGRRRTATSSGTPGPPTHPEPLKWALPRLTAASTRSTSTSRRSRPTAIGDRTFGVWFEGGQVEEALDVYKVAGGADIGIVRTHQATVQRRRS